MPEKRYSSLDEDSVWGEVKESHEDEIEREIEYKEIERERFSDLSSLGKPMFESIENPVRTEIVEEHKVTVAKVDLNCWEEMTSLRLKVQEVTGSLLERRDFLRERVKFLKEKLKERKELHEKIMEDIDKDIEEKENIMRKMSKPDEIRDISLDISSLRSQKRKEKLLFWKDICELENELQITQEELRIAEKLAKIVESENGN